MHQLERGKVKYASAHDLRRSFGFRWAMRVMPPVLMQMMRHESIQTTQQFYVGRNAEMAAEAIWDTGSNVDMVKERPRMDSTSSEKDSSQCNTTQNDLHT